EPAGLATYGNLGSGQGYAIQVDLGGEVVVNGGSFDSLSAVAPTNNTNCLAPMMSSRGSRLVLNGVTLRSGPPRSASATRSNGIAGCTGSVELNDTRVSGFVGGTTNDIGVGVFLQGGSLTMTNSVLDANRYGISAISGTVTLRGTSRVEASQVDGIYLSGNSILTMEPGSAVNGSGGHGVNTRGSVDMFLDLVSAELSGNALSGLRLEKVTQCRARGSLFLDNVQAG